MGLGCPARSTEPQGVPRLMIALLLRNWRTALWAGSVAAAFIAGAYVGSEYRVGQFAKIEAARLEAERERVREANRNEAMRLMREADAEAEYRRIKDEARSDPDGSLPALGVRDTERLNSVR